MKKAARAKKTDVELPDDLDIQDDLQDDQQQDEDDDDGDDDDEEEGDESDTGRRPFHEVCFHQNEVHKDDV